MHSVKSFPTRPQKTRKVVDNDVVLGDGEEYAAPGENDFQCDDIPDYGELFGNPDDDDADGGPRNDHPSRKVMALMMVHRKIFLTLPSMALAELPLMKGGASSLLLASRESS